MTDWIQKITSYTFKTGCQPYARIGHRAILMGSNILVIGGTNYHHQVVTEILNINCESYQVSLLITKNSVPIESFSLHSYDDKIYLWGGKRTSGGHTFVSNQLWKLQNGLFSKITQKGQIPSPRYCHCSVIYAKKYMVIYGGLSETQVFNDWYVLNLQTFEWKKMSSVTNIPYNLQSKMVWLQTRGIVLVSQKWDQLNDKVEYCCDIYQFSIRKKDNNFQVLIEKVDFQFKQKMAFRGFPTICKYAGQSLSLAIIGGQKLDGQDYEEEIQMFSDCWMLNLDTFECSKADQVQLTSKYGHEAIFYKDRILLIGGVTSTNQFASSLQTIDFKLKQISIDRKLCQSCKSIYGLQDYTKHKLSVKCDYESKPKSFISAKLVQKFSDLIRNPIKAFGLLIDNSLNMNANSINLQFKRVKLDQKIYKNPVQTIIQITDNSYGFTKEEILQSLFTFGYKIETFTHDSKFEEQLAVRKEYGLNLKLGSMRLGKSCLLVMNTIEDEKFVGYFSIDPTKCPDFKDRFNCFYYFINNEKLCSSELNRHIIKRNVEHQLEIEQLQSLPETINKIFIMDFNYRNQFVLSETNQGLICDVFQDEGQLFYNLSAYLKHLYLKPYFGRKITIGENILTCDSVIQKFKSDQIQGKIQKIDLIKVQQLNQIFQTCCLYDVIDKSYESPKVIIYSENRLICSMDFQDQKMCGVIELKSDVEISVGKCSIQSKMEQKRLKRFIGNLKSYNGYKRSFSSLKKDEQKLIENLSKPVKKIKEDGDQKKK